MEKTPVPTKKKHLDLAYATLLGGDEEAILSALARIEKDGDASAIRPLLLGLVSAKEGRVQQRITSMLFAIKATNATTVLLDALEDPELAPVRNTVLATFWNAGLDVRDHLDRFVTIALDGNADACFECLTVIENQEIWPEKATRLALAKVEKALLTEADTYKHSMLKDLASVLAYRLGEDS